MRRGIIVVIAALLSAGIRPAAADTLKLFAAGSLSDAFSDLLRRFPAGPDAAAAPEFGPSGLLRTKIESGAPADMLASADMDQPRRLAVGHPERMVIEFTRNKLCAIARPSVGLTQANMLDKFLDPAVRVATSTPGADPGGDYAFAAFAKAEFVRPGARARLEAKALKLVGGGDKTPLLVPGKGPVEGVFIADRADVMVGYCSGATGLLAAIPGLVSVSLPQEMSVSVAYGMVVLDNKPVALRFAEFVMSETGQSILGSHGFDPVGLADHAGTKPAVLVQRAGQASIMLTPERIAGLKPITQRVSFMSDHGSRDDEWTGPLLWDVLSDIGAIDPSKPGEQVRATVRVTGADGYSAVFGLAEISPQFAGKMIQIATAMDSAPLSTLFPRLIVPGERRGGRSVHDVVRIDIQ